MHAADLSNAFKPYDISEKWSFKVLNEFWNQVINTKIHFFEKKYFFRGIKKGKMGLVYPICVIDIQPISLNLKWDLLILLSCHFILKSPISWKT